MKHEIPARRRRHLSALPAIRRRSRDHQGERVGSGEGERRRDSEEPDANETALELHDEP